MLIVNWTKLNRSHLICFDVGPLVRIKQALTRLKQEVQQMEVRIGVVCIVLLVFNRTPFYNRVVGENGVRLRVLYSLLFDQNQR